MLREILKQFREHYNNSIYLDIVVQKCVPSMLIHNNSLISYTARIMRNIIIIQYILLYIFNANASSAPGSGRKNINFFTVIIIYTRLQDVKII